MAAQGRPGAKLPGCELRGCFWTASAPVGVGCGAIILLSHLKTLAYGSHLGSGLEEAESSFCCQTFME